MKNNFIQMKRKNLYKITTIFLLVSVVSFTSCREKNGLPVEYMPDMYRSPSMETYVDYGELRGKQGNDSIKNTMEARIPVKGTIPRGFMPYPYANTIDGYNAAGKYLKSPFPYTKETVKKGEKLFTMFCVFCHGKTGQGDGTLVKRGKFPPLPVKFNKSLNLPEGKMFHTITYGKGLMGSHASQVTKTERWYIIHYIRTKFMGIDFSDEPIAADNTQQTTQKNN